MKNEFVAFKDQTHEPEKFPGLSHLRPVGNPPFRYVLREFTVAAWKRPDGRRMRCPACGQDNKFETGCLVFYPEEGVLRVIGNDCGDQRRHEANSHHQRRVRLENLNDWLYKRLPHVAEYIEAARGLEEAALHAQHLHRQLRTEGKTFFQAIQRGLKSGGGANLTVAREVLGPDGTHSSYSEPVAHVDGVAFVRPTYNPVHRLTQAMQMLTHAFRGDSEEAALHWQLRHHEDLDALEEVSQGILKGNKLVAETVELVSAALAFLTPQNTQGINRWGDEARNYVRATAGTQTFFFEGPPKVETKHRSATLKPDLQMLRRAVFKWRGLDYEPASLD